MDFLTPAIIGLHLFSVHIPGGGQDNNINYGLYMQTKTGIVVGGFKNSYSRPSFYIGQSWSLNITENINGSIILGAISGYDLRQYSSPAYFDSNRKYVPAQHYETGRWNDPFGPLIAPSVLLWDTVRITILPSTHTAIHLSLERKL